jgi:hypothetical protein
MNLELPKNFEFFDKTNIKAIENLIREQGDEVCNNKIGRDYIKNKLKNCDFGFIRKSIKAKIGQIQTRKNKQHLHSFVLCKLLPNPYLNKIDITLVCSRINSKDGKQLLELVEKYAQTINYNCLSLIAIGNTRLVNWYKSQGYLLETDKDIMDSNLKSYYMAKYI